MMKQQKLHAAPRRLTRLFFLLLATLVILSASVIPAAAATVGWELSDDGKTLTHGDETYEAYLLPLGYTIRPHAIYEYVEMVSYRTVSADQPAHEIHWLAYYASQATVYLTSEKLHDLESFFDGEAAIFYMSDVANGFAAKDLYLKPSFTDALFSFNGEKAELDVRDDLYNAPIYPILAYDDSATLCFTYGAFYEVDGELYFVDYTALGNEHFDAEGNFSYRSGTVEATRLSGSIADSAWERIEELGDSYYDPEYTFEEGDYLAPNPDDYSPILFWGCYILIGFIIPTAALVIGLILPRNQKLGKPVYWYSMAIAAGVWIVATLVLMIMLL